MATEKQIAANRLNALKGGVKTEEGKAISRLNARKYGIFASAFTSQDARELRGIHEQLAAELHPSGMIQEILVEKLAVTYLRMQRCARAEAEHHKTFWTWPMPGGRANSGKNLLALGMHDVRLTNQFLKLLHELERRQKAGVPQPAQAGSLSDRPQDVGLPPVQNMENEPNSATEAPATDLASPPGTERQVDLAAAGEMKNEPNSSEAAQAAQEASPAAITEPVGDAARDNPSFIASAGALALRRSRP
jgi:hypothetical protein